MYDDNPSVMNEWKDKWASRPNIFFVKKLTKVIIDNMSMIVLSPGVKISSIIKYAILQGKDVLSELELGYRSCNNTFVAITGTNGKTTTTKLLGDIYSYARRKVSVVGNIGVPVCSLINKATKHDTFVCEVSSFQLESTHSFKPHICAITNITADHLDRHGSIYNYTNVKYKITARQGKKDYIVLNNNLRHNRLVTMAKKYYFGFEKCRGAYVDDGKIYFCHKKSKYIMDLSDIKLLGRHNIENVLCAVACACLDGIKPKFIRQAVVNFVAPHHRLEVVDTINGIDFINDSKATNIDSCIRAVRSISDPIILLLGGSDKGEDFAQLFDNLPENIRAIIVTGETADKIVQASHTHTLIKAENLRSAVKKAYDIAHIGDKVLLSPACASFDEFVSYADRGQKFVQYVGELSLEK